MTENKPIIINGVDVSKCFELGETISGITCGNGTKIRLADRYIYKYKLCKDNPNCLFKQLHRYKQVVKEIKEILQNEHPFVDCSCGQDLLQIIQKCEEVI